MRRKEGSRRICGGRGSCHGGEIDEKKGEEEGGERKKDVSNGGGDQLERMEERGGKR